MPDTADRLKGFTESVIREMTRVANTHGAINLAQGFPDFEPPEVVLEALERAVRRPVHQYSITWGAPNFRAALAEKLRRFTGLAGIDPDKHLVTTCGSTEAMMVAVMTACNPGDRVIVFTPFYENYAADAILSGAVPVFIPLRPPTFEFDAEELAHAFRQHRPKAIILCNPANPSGRVFRADELEVIARLAVEHDAFVIVDEVYEHIVYAPHRHIYFATLPGMWERTITCGSLSKTYSITGWRLGYVLAHERVIAGARKVHDFLTVGAAAPLQEAAVTALQLGDDYYAGLARDYATRRELFLGYLRDAGLEFETPEGAYYVLVNIQSFGYERDTDFALWLAKEVGVAGVPGSSFFRNTADPGAGVHTYIRFHFAKRLETLDAAGRRLLNLRCAWQGGAKAD
ncbi:aminotransferase [Verrucomicrobia bacterium LW23]|nr:aminotransferase [Verrucomicrobia bacterium LW23]